MVTIQITRWFHKEKPRAAFRESLVEMPPELGAKDLLKWWNKLDFAKWSEFSINPKMTYCTGISDLDLKIKIEKDIRHYVELAIKYISLRSLEDGAYERLHKHAEKHFKVFLIGEHGTEGFMKYHFHGVIKGLPNDVMSRLIGYLREKIGRVNKAYIRKEEDYRKYVFKSNMPDDPKRETWGKHSYIKINLETKVTEYDSLRMERDRVKRLTNTEYEQKILADAECAHSDYMHPIQLKYCSDS